MNFKNILITGGAGFVGSNLAVMLKESFPSLIVATADNLKRRGSEFNIPRLTKYGISFLHGDIRCREDVDEWPDFDLLIDCSAEPSVQAGITDSPMGVLQNNLTGTMNCIEAARKRNAAFLFLSTSRVYPIASLNGLPWKEEQTRFKWEADGKTQGLSKKGITEEFPLKGARSMYGSTKLAAELVLQEYAYSFNMPALINRCGVISGPWQMGKVDQGFIALWTAKHIYENPLKYIGYGGTGKQVRDALHINDLFQLLLKQMNRPDTWDGRVYNVGGGNDVSTSLLELTAVCREITGKSIDISSVPETSAVDLRIYITDSSRVMSEYGWQPEKKAADIVSDIAIWITDNKDSLKSLFC